MAGPPKVKIGEKDARRLDALQARIERAEDQADHARALWAATVRAVGISAVARRMGISRQTLAERIKAIEARGA